MPVVGLILGLVLAVWISVFTLFNDAFIQQPLMTGNLMPTSVYGPAVLLTLLAAGLSWKKLRQRNLVGRADLVVMIVIATAACAWPGTNFLRTFVGSTGNVANLAKTQDHWRSADVLTHLPQGVILADGIDTPGVTDRLTTGADDPDAYRVSNVPWKNWWPVLRLWGGVALLLGLASVCVGLIVHPQWSRYERLPYPLVRFIEELIKPHTPGKLNHHTTPKNAAKTSGDGVKTPGASVTHPEGAATPSEGSVTSSAGITTSSESGTKTSGGGTKASGGGLAVLHNPLFWIGLASVVTIHLLNGLWAWDIEIVKIPLAFDFKPMTQLMPNAARVFGGGEQFLPTIYFSIVAFVFFIRGDVSFSVGISNFVWVALGVMFLARGESLGNNPIETDSGTLLRAGSYLGFAAMILYLGRRHYLRIASSAVGLRRCTADERSGVWAARLLVFTLAGAVWLLARYADLDWRLGVVTVLLVMVILLILARLSAETGMFYLEPNWMPLVVVSAMLGFEGLGPTAFLVVALISTVIAGAPREPLLGYVVNGLALSERVGKNKRLGRVGLGIAGVAVAALGLALLATLVLSYTRGLSPHDPWANLAHPALPFDALARRLSEFASLGRLDSVIAEANAGHFAAAAPDAAALGWLAVGIALVVGCTLARLRLAWWPIHPVLFLVLGSSPAIRVGWSFLIGWAIRQAVVRLGGVKAFHATLPLAVGVIAGELLAALGWQAAGITTYLITGLPPSGYLILPN